MNSATKDYPSIHSSAIDSPSNSSPGQTEVGMSQVEILHATFSPIDHDISRPENPSFFHDLENVTRANTNALVHDILSSPSPLRLNTETAESPHHEENLFHSLPPVHIGHPEIHLRNGVMNASMMANDGEPDAEKAFFVADLSQVYRQHQRWVSCLPEITPYYGLSMHLLNFFSRRLIHLSAVKCNPDPYVLRLLAALGTGFDCASNGEISRVLSIGGVDPSRIIFANPCKANSFIRNAGKLGVDTMTFDNMDELYKVARTHPRAKLVVRILTDDTKSLCQLGLKYGAPLVTVPALLSKARELNLDVIGVSFHVGSGCYDPTVYSDAIARARYAFDMAKEAGFSFTLLDVGGGFEDASFEQAASVLKDAIEEHFPDRRNIRVIAEPGRFYVSKAFSLAANIIARRAPFSDSAEMTTGNDQPSVMCEPYVLSFF